MRGKNPWRSVEDEAIGWTNPPHRTHLCQHCGHLWRPYEVATNGITRFTNADERIDLIADLRAQLAAAREKAVRECVEMVEDTCGGWISKDCANQAAQHMRDTLLPPSAPEMRDLARERSMGEIDAPHGWIWLDDDGWEHNPDPQHPHERGEAEYGTEFRPATREEASSRDFLRVGVVVYSFGGPEHG